MRSFDINVDWPIRDLCVPSQLVVLSNGRLNFKFQMRKWNFYLLIIISIRGMEFIRPYEMETIQSKTLQVVLKTPPILFMSKVCVGVSQHLVIKMRQCFVMHNHSSLLEFNFNRLESGSYVLLSWIENNSWFIDWKPAVRSFIQRSENCNAFISIITPILGQLMTGYNVHVRALVRVVHKDRIFESFTSESKFCVSVNGIQLQCSYQGEFHLNSLPPTPVWRIRVWLSDSRAVCPHEIETKRSCHEENQPRVVLIGKEYIPVDAAYHPFTLTRSNNVHQSTKHCPRVPNLQKYCKDFHLVIINSLHETINWTKYVTDEWYELFQSLNWEFLTPVEFSNRSGTAPDHVILFEVPKMNDLQYLTTSQENNTSLLTDDLHNSGLSRKNYRSYMDRFNWTMVFSTYAYLVDSKDRVVWSPHIASETFLFREINKRPIPRVLLFGSLEKKYYPIRHWISQQVLLGQDTLVDVHPHPGYENHRFYHTIHSQSATATLVHSYLAVFTDTSRLQYIVSKIMEIPATGALLLVNSDAQEILQPLGFEPWVHYIGYSPENPRLAMEWATHPMHRRIVDRIRRSGQKLVQSLHTSHHRQMHWCQILKGEEDEEPFSIPMKFKADGCPVVGESERECKEIVDSIR